MLENNKDINILDLWLTRKKFTLTKKCLLFYICKSLDGAAKIYSKFVCIIVSLLSSINARSKGFFS